MGQILDPRFENIDMGSFDINAKFSSKAHKTRNFFVKTASI